MQRARLSAGSSSRASTRASGYFGVARVVTLLRVALCEFADELAEIAALEAGDPRGLRQVAAGAGEQPLDVHAGETREHLLLLLGVGLGHVAQPRKQRSQLRELGRSLERNASHRGESRNRVLELA